MLLLNKSDVGSYTFTDIIREGVDRCLSSIKVHELIFWGVQYTGDHNSKETTVMTTFLSYLFLFFDFFGHSSLFRFPVGSHFLFTVEMNGKQDT